VKSVSTAITDEVYDKFRLINNTDITRYGAYNGNDEVLREAVSKLKRGEAITFK